MYYRRKLILGILEEFGGKLNHTTFQKILFLITREQPKKSFDFVPYKFGCFSFQANQDLQTLGKYGHIKVSDEGQAQKWSITENNSKFFKVLTGEDQKAIKEVKREIVNFSQRDLVKHTYLNFPYYASKSQIVDEVLSSDEKAKVNKQIRNIKKSEFFTIGYEGISLENYLNKLIINDVKLLCDVRKNPLSRKYGFSKSQLKNACESLGIKYVHIPELGIESHKRQELNSDADYKLLFKEYEKTTLPRNKKFLMYLNDLIKANKRVAITCFEKEVHMCHRSRVLNALISNPNWKIPYKNL